MLTCVESRAPLVPIGSFTTCTISVWPSKTIFSIGVMRRVRMRLARNARMPDIGDMQERGTLQPDIDERGLHARQHAHDLAEIDVADAPPRQRAFDVKFLHGALLDERDARFLRRDVDQDFFIHGVVLEVDARYAQECCGFEKGQTHDTRIGPLDPLDKLRRASLDAIRAGLAERLAGGRVTLQCSTVDAGKAHLRAR